MTSMQQDNIEKIFYIIRLRHYYNTVYSQNKFIQNNHILESINLNSKEEPKSKNFRCIKQWKKLFETFSSHIYSHLSPELVDLSDKNLLQYLNSNEKVKIQVDSLKEINKNLAIFDNIYYMLSQLFLRYVNMPSEIYFSEDSDPKPRHTTSNAESKQKKVKAQNSNEENTGKSRQIRSRSCHNRCHQTEETTMINELPLNNEFIEKFVSKLPSQSSNVTFNNTAEGSNTKMSVNKYQKLEKGFKTLQRVLSKYMDENSLLKTCVVEKSAELKNYKERWIKLENANKCLHAELQSSQVSTKKNHIKWMELANCLKTPVLSELKRSESAQQLRSVESKVMHEKIEKLNEMTLGLQANLNIVNSKLETKSEELRNVKNQNLLLEQRYHEFISAKSKLERLDKNLQQIHCNISHLTKSVVLTKSSIETSTSESYEAPDSNILMLLRSALAITSNISLILKTPQLCMSIKSGICDSEAQTDGHCFVTEREIESIGVEKMMCDCSNQTTPVTICIPNTAGDILQRAKLISDKMKPSHKESRSHTKTKKLALQQDTLKVARLREYNESNKNILGKSSLKKQIFNSLSLNQNNVEPFHSNQSEMKVCTENVSTISQPIPMQHRQLLKLLIVYKQLQDTLNNIRWRIVKTSLSKESPNSCEELSKSIDTNLLNNTHLSDEDSDSLGSGLTISNFVTLSTNSPLDVDGSQQSYITVIENPKLPQDKDFKKE